MLHRLILANHFLKDRINLSVGLLLHIYWWSSFKSMCCFRILSRMLESYTHTIDRRSYAKTFLSLKRHIIQLLIMCDPIDQVSVSVFGVMSFLVLTELQRFMKSRIDSKSLPPIRIFLNCLLFMLDFSFWSSLHWPQLVSPDLLTTVNIFSL